MPEILNRAYEAIGANGMNAPGLASLAHLCSVLFGVMFYTL